MSKVTIPGFYHPESKLQFPWVLAQFGTLILPFFPAVGAVILGLSLLVTWAFKYQTIIQRRFNWGFAILSILLIISTVFAYDKNAAVLGICNFLPFFLLLTAFGVLIQTPVQLRLLSWIIVVASVPVVIIGIGQLFFGWTTGEFWFNISGWKVAPGGNPVGRMASVFMYANVLAGYLITTFILSVGLLLEAGNGGGRERGREGERGGRIYTLIFLSLTVIGNFASLILTNSRNAWAIAIFACVAYAMYQGWRIVILALGTIATSVILAAFAPNAIAFWFRKVVPSFFWARLNDQMYPDRPVALIRKTQWDFAWSLAQQRPLTGWGLRNFTPLYQEQMHIWLGHPHNFFLMLSAETGFPATLLFCSLIIWIVLTSLQVIRKPRLLNQNDKLIFFSYFLVLLAWIFFNTADVSLFDFRLNVFSWFLLGAISGVTYQCLSTPKSLVK
ncbi:O-antigen ligase family protein [Calothrix sp. PCC 6303]|uniref:O-antigen ligase family protein n=1 Tax=Calothrix sp. PCC 6303 TaxID=1170562 RepID=UPI0002A01808|nr:O-antigen ligase family protein [Calothrix sp. PCC 6303]AFZ02410.1 O-antigen polymerase [Calothrix sp. PCC 6303]